MHFTLPIFLEALFTEGRVRVAPPVEISDDELREADDVLARFEWHSRQELPGTPPLLFPPVTRWGAVMFHRACQFVAFRDIGEAAMAEALNTSCPGGNAPTVHYSVDLIFRYLPDLFKLAQAASQGDPLVKHLAAWVDRGRCRRWVLPVRSLYRWRRLSAIRAY